ncbi:MAG: KilA-N domain-containing protein [Cyanomargarita calcarea GSE-NOS-MK-12-04C]|jgi:hypothetical protein|uniref:KilA-N domain-containing protein n=1 Tax=Cyanomargarita calcarea GSE-NOS-MK-12-04C TaxID=2839659 RepID=A0A951QIE6_9CYAN|nr:KilA-N domain-containing protein [Cyanomargarita calcarea GSE-NOS-MK-12-04C]
MNIIPRNWNGRTIRQREDGYWSATDMCQACGKLWGDWSRLSSTKEYLKVLQNKHYADSHNGQLIDSSVGGTPETTGTWVYRKVALRLAQWLSPEFAVQVDEWVEELLTTGKVELTPPKTQAEMLLIYAQQLVDLERSQKALEQEQERLNQNQKQLNQKQSELTDRVEQVEHEQDRFNAPCGHKYTVLGYSKKLGLEISLKESSNKGKKAACLCRQMGIEIEQVDDPRFGMVGLYPQSILAQVFGEGL